MSTYFLYPIYIVMFLFGCYLFWNDRKRQQYIKDRLVTSINDNELTADEVAEQKTSSVEKLYRKSSKAIAVTALLDRNVTAKAMTVAVAAIFLYLSSALGIFELSSSTMAMILLVVMIAIVLLPAMIKKQIIFFRTKKLTNDLPFIIDMMAVCIQSGMTVEKALRYLADNAGDINPDIAALFDRAMIKSEVSGIASALDLLYSEVPCAEIRMFSSTLQQSIKFGSSIYEMLLALSKEMREMQLLQAEEKISSLATKIIFPMFAFIMAPVLAMVAGPGILRMASLM